MATCIQTFDSFTSYTGYPTLERIYSDKKLRRFQRCVSCRRHLRFFVCLFVCLFHIIYSLCSSYLLSLSLPSHTSSPHAFHTHFHCFFSILCRYLVTELMGSDLHKIVRTQSLSDEHVQFFIYQILRGLKVHNFNPFPFSLLRCIMLPP